MVLCGVNLLIFWSLFRIKKLLWPQVPDPSDSSIAHWSPDFPIKVRELQSIKIMDESHKNMSIKIPFHYEVVVAVMHIETLKFSVMYSIYS